MMSARVMSGGDEPASLLLDDVPALTPATSPDEADLRAAAPREPQAAACRLDRELEIFRALRRGASHVSVWQPQQALAVTGLEAASPRFAHAASAAARRGFPVHVRGSGGGCVCLGPGTLVVSHLYCAESQGIERAYRDFAAKLLAAAARLRAPLRMGPAAGTNAHGRYELACQGLKLGGIAQRRGAGSSVTRIWVHAVLAVEECAAAYPQQVQAFYRDLGSERSAPADLTTVLARCVPPQLTTGLTARLRDDLLRLFALAVSPPAPCARTATFRSSKDCS